MSGGMNVNELFAGVKLDKLEAQRDELADLLRRLNKFTFMDRWPTKGLDDEAQALHDEITVALGKAGMTLLTVCIGLMGIHAGRLL